MEDTPAGIESELLDFSTENVATLRSAELAGITAAITRVRERIADPDGSISSYNPSFSKRAARIGSEAEDHVA